MNQAVKKKQTLRVTSSPCFRRAPPTSAPLSSQCVYTSVSAPRTADTICGEFMWCFSLERFSSWSGPHVCGADSTAIELRGRRSESLAPPPGPLLIRQLRLPGEYSATTSIVNSNQCFCQSEIGKIPPPLGFAENLAISPLWCHSAPVSNRIPGQATVPPETSLLLFLFFFYLPKQVEGLPKNQF